jgi:hypothetical protein
MMNSSFLQPLLTQCVYRVAGLTAFLLLSFMGFTQTMPPAYVVPRPGQVPLPNPHANQGASPRSSHCNTASAQPCPLDDAPIKYLGVNAYFLLNPDGTGNFTETGDGAGGSFNGYQRAEELIETANKILMDRKERQWQTTNALCKINIRLVLTISPPSVEVNCSNKGDF